MKYIDLSQRIEPTMEVYPGDPGVKFSARTSYEKEGCLVTQLEFGTHTGTHLDAPKHFLRNGAGVEEIPLESLSGEAVCVRARLHYAGSAGHPVIELDDTERARIMRQDRVLVYTGWESTVGTAEYFDKYPIFSLSVLEFLIKKRIRMLGVDLPTVVCKGDEFSEMHMELLSRAIIPIEGLVNLSTLAGRRFFFSAVPLKLAGGDGSPVRAYAMVKR